MHTSFPTSTVGCDPERVLLDCLSLVISTKLLAALLFCLYQSYRLPLSCSLHQNLHCFDKALRHGALQSVCQKVSLSPKAELSLWFVSFLGRIYATGQELKVENSTLLLLEWPPCSTSGFWWREKYSCSTNGFCCGKKHSSLWLLFSLLFSERNHCLVSKLGWGQSGCSILCHCWGKVLALWIGFGWQDGLSALSSMSSENRAWTT